MVTAATNFPYPYYHTSEDTADKIGFDRQTRVGGDWRMCSPNRWAVNNSGA